MAPAPPPRPGMIEEEFGVPIPGVIVEPHLWTRSALKKFPEGQLDWGILFEAPGKIVIDIGCGNGRSTLQSAVGRPEFNHLGVDILPVVIRYATRRANQRGLTNVKFGVIGGRELLADHVPAGSVNEVHCFHPQPYADPREFNKRMITPEFLLLVYRALQPGGKLILQTDNRNYWQYMEKIVPAVFDWQVQSGPWPDSPRGRTRREIMAISKRLPIFRGVATVRLDRSLDQATQIAASLPPPTFRASGR